MISTVGMKTLLISKNAFSDDNRLIQMPLYDSWIAGHDSEFNEEEHPRGKGGKFAKKGFRFRSFVQEKLLLKIYKEKHLLLTVILRKVCHLLDIIHLPTLLTSSLYRSHCRKSGNILPVIMPSNYHEWNGSACKASRTTPVAEEDRSYPPVKVPPKTEAKATQSVIDPFPSIASGKIEHESATAEYTTNALGFKPVDEDDVWINYKDTKGNALSLAKKSDKDGYFEWGLYNGETANFTKGKGLTPLTEAVSAATIASHKEAAIAGNPHVKDSLSAVGFTPTLKGPGWTSFTHPDGTEVTVSDNENSAGNYNWTMTAANGGGIMTEEWFIYFSGDKICWNFK